MHSRAIRFPGWARLIAITWTTLAERSRAETTAPRSWFSADSCSDVSWRNRRFEERNSEAKSRAKSPLRPSIIVSNLERTAFKQIFYECYWLQHTPTLRRQHNDSSKRDLAAFIYVDAALLRFLPPFLFPLRKEGSSVSFPPFFVFSTPFPFRFSSFSFLLSQRKKWLSK